tara:strand:- start:110 stop:544 length:435 start_codon:yes stop_codon:yes gene_type:complete
MLFVSCIKSKAKSIEGTYTVGVRIENSSGMSVGGNVNSDNFDCYVEIQKVKSNKALVIAYIEDSLIFNQELELKKARDYSLTNNSMRLDPLGDKVVYYGDSSDDVFLYCWPNIKYGQYKGELTFHFHNHQGMKVIMHGRRLKNN